MTLFKTHLSCSINLTKFKIYRSFTFAKTSCVNYYFEAILWISGGLLFTKWYSLVMMPQLFGITRMNSLQIGRLDVGVTDWPLKSIDLSPLDVFAWGLYQITSLYNEDNLQECIWNATDNLMMQMLQWLKIVQNKFNFTEKYPVWFTSQHITK